MVFNGYLTSRDINELTEAALSGGLMDVPRQLLLDGIPSAFAANLARTDNPLNQLKLDLINLSRVERMVGGEVPILYLLQNMAAQLRLLGRAEAGVFERFARRIANLALGVPALPSPAPVPEVAENERISGTDNAVAANGRLRAGPDQNPVGAATSTPPARSKSIWQRFMSSDVAIRAALIGAAAIIIAALIPYLLGAFSGSGGSPSNSGKRSPVAQSSSPSASRSASSSPSAAMVPPGGFAIFSGDGYRFNLPDAIASSGSDIWVANFMGNSVTEMNASTGRLIRVLSASKYGFDHPRAIAVTGSYVWVADSYSSVLTEINASDGSFVRIVPGFAGPNGIAVAGSHIWVTNDGGQGGASVIELSATTGKRLALITGAFYRFNLPDAIASSGSDIWVANFMGNSVTEMNASTGRLIRVLSASKYGFDHPRAIAVAGSYVWVADSYSSVLTEINASDGSFVRIVPGFAGPNGIAVAGSHIWVTNDGGQGGASVIELSATTGARLKLIAGADYRFSQPDAITANRFAIWIANKQGNSVTEIATK